jgi:CheY-like chemotaxis protein
MILDGGRDMRVLVVDDQEMQVDLVGSQLSHAGYEVTGCYCGEEAVNTLKSQAVDLVITDMEMGVMTGEDVLKYVRSEIGSLPVILMSGNLYNLEKNGFDGYLAKPFSMRELLTVVERLSQ